MNGQNPVFIPGPTNIPDPIRRALDIQTLDHRAPEFGELITSVLIALKRIFQTRTGQVLIFPASGTGGWEAAVMNTLSPGDTVLAARCGMFSHRWIDLCRRQGLNVETIESDWGSGAPADLYGERLANDKDKSIKAVLVTHNETSTGVRSDISAVRQELDATDHPAFLFVDCVSSFASMDFRMDEWGVDVAVTGSQKGLMLTAGLAIVGISEKAFKRLGAAENPRCYFDFQEMAKAVSRGGFPYTPPLQLINGLQESLRMLLGEGLENVYARHYRIAEGVRAAVYAWGLKLAANSPNLYSDTVSAIYVPPGFNSDELTNHAYETYRVSYGVGLGEMSGRVFRIGHLGSLTDVMTLSGLATIEMAMKDLGYPIELGAGVAAAQEYYRGTVSAESTKAA